MYKYKDRYHIVRDHYSRFSGAQFGDMAIQALLCFVALYFLYFSLQMCCFFFGLFRTVPAAYGGSPLIESKSYYS